MRAALLIAPIALIGLSVPVFAGEKEDRLAACMWERMPESADRFVRASTPQEETKGLFDGLAVCSEGDLKVNTRALKKRLQETRPAVIVANTEQPAVFVCTKKADGTCEESK